MKTEILSTHTAELFRAAVQRAAALLRSGETVALPTETVYGLAANALDPAAVAKIYDIKGRPRINPIIVHVADFEMARRCVAAWPELADRLASAFWPGPLTIILPRSTVIPDIVTASGPTVGIRWPGHPFMQAVIRECGFPLAAPSANKANEISPTSAEHIYKSLGGKLPLIVDGGQSHVGIESTVLDLTAQPPRLLRPGMIHEPALLSITGELTLGLGDEDILKSPGQLKKHYAPQAKLIILSWNDDTDLCSQLSTLQRELPTTHIIAHNKIPLDFAGRVSVIPHDPEAYARALYSELHRCDAEGASLIIVEALPEAPEWRGISDRLRRAAA